MRPDLVVERAKLYETATKRACQDPDFRARLVADPRATLDALAKELNLAARVPDGVAIDVVDCTDDKLVLVLPPLDEPLLSETELDRIAAGVNLPGSATLQADSHGCPACPHTSVGPEIQFDRRKS